MAITGALSQIQVDTSASVSPANRPYVDIGYQPNVIFNIPATAVTAGTPVTIGTAPAGKRFRVLEYALSLSVAGSVILKEAGTEFLRTPLLAAGIGQSSPDLGFGYLAAAQASTLQIDATASGTISGYVLGLYE